MQALTTAGADVVEGSTPGYDLRLTITLPDDTYSDMTLAIDQLTLDESLTTDMPAETQPDTGYSSRSLQFTLSGLVDVTDAAKTAAWLFWQYQTDSPLFRSTVKGSDVLLEIGVLTDAGTEWITKFTGTVDQVTVDMIAGTAQFSCVDGRNALRALPAVDARIPFTDTVADGQTSEFAVDALLRAASGGGAVSSWPKRRDDCILAVGFRASLLPEVGTLNIVKDSLGFGLVFNFPAYATGPTGGSGLIPGPGDSIDPTAVQYDLTAKIDRTVYAEVLVLGHEFLLAIGGDMYIKIWSPFDNQVQLHVFDSDDNDLGNGTATVAAIDSGTHVVGVLVNLPAVGGTSYSATVWVDAVEYSITAFTATSARTSEDWDSASVELKSAALQATNGVIAGLQITTESDPTPSVHDPKALLDPSLNHLIVMPAIPASDDVWQSIQQIASAEMAVAFLDEEGIFHWYNRDTLTTVDVSRTIYPKSMKALAAATTAAGLRNSIHVSCTGWVFGDVGAIWQADTALEVKAHSTRVVQVTLDGIASPSSVGDTINGSLLGNGTSGADTEVLTYRSSLDAAGVAVGPALTFRIDQPASNQLTVSIINSTGRDAWLVSPATYTDLTAGTPCLNVGGIPITPGDTTVAALSWPPASEGGPSPAVDLTVDNSGGFIEDPASAQKLAVFLLGDLATDRPVLSGLSILPDPRIQLTDRNILALPDYDLHVIIRGQHLDFAYGQLSHQIDARAVGSPGSWLMGITGRDELGTNTYV